MKRLHNSIKHFLSVLYTKTFDNKKERKTMKNKCCSNICYHIKLILVHTYLPCVRFCINVETQKFSETCLLIQLIMKYAKRVKFHSNYQSYIFHLHSLQFFTA